MCEQLNKISFIFTADTPFSQVKIRDLPAWFARREKGLKPFASLISRGILLNKVALPWLKNYITPLLFVSDY